MGLQAVEIVVALVVGLFGLLLLALGLRKAQDLDDSLEIVSRLSDQDANWQTLLAVVVIVAALYFARRGMWVLALYLGILGANDL
jgi:cadmium resistance protein CadD (predicted permease)